MTLNTNNGQSVNFNPVTMNLEIMRSGNIIATIDLISLRESELTIDCLDFAETSKSTLLINFCSE